MFLRIAKSLKAAFGASHQVLRRVDGTQPPWVVIHWEHVVVIHWEHVHEQPIHNGHKRGGNEERARDGAAQHEVVVELSTILRVRWCVAVTVNVIRAVPIFPLCCYSDLPGVAVRRCCHRDWRDPFGCSHSPLHREHHSSCSHASSPLMLIVWFGGYQGHTWEGALMQYGIPWDRAPVFPCWALGVRRTMWLELTSLLPEGPTYVFLKFVTCWVVEAFKCLKTLGN